MYRYGVKNTYRPTGLINKAYGFSSAPGYTRADIPTAMLTDTGLQTDQLLQQFAYEWYQSGSVAVGYSNPPFVSGAAGRLLPSLTSTRGGGAIGSGQVATQPARILRGYIRRAQTEAGDEKSKSRLYFMYNPETITRDYVSYLDQAALDPFNTVYQSGNLVAPPSILDFSFDLFFDRQEEADDPNHPGVLVDYQFFDLVVRNVVPSQIDPTSNTIPDNGVMMVNPRDITVVFSPQFTVQGRPLNARVTFEKFTHRMVPVRMRVSLVMRAVYIGPVKDMTEYRAEVFAAEATIPFTRTGTEGPVITMLDATTAAATTGTDTGSTPPLAAEGAITVVHLGTNNYSAQLVLATNANARIRQSALNWAINHVKEGVTTYDKGSRFGPNSFDCSGLVTRAYKAVGQQGTVFNGTDLATYGMWSWWRGAGKKYCQELGNAYHNSNMQYGDIMLKDGHVVFYIGIEANTGKWVVFDAASSTSHPQVGYHSYSQNHNYTCFRPIPLGASMSANAPNS
jgi:hypothetical protein